MDDPLRNPKDKIEELIYGKRELRRRERQAELEHEYQLAVIRTQSHALVWTGTAVELTRIIEKWYKFGWLFAESLEDAMQRASIHFVKPDGTQIIRPLTSMADQDATAIFSTSPTYQKITFRGKEYDLTQHRYAPMIVRVLHESLGKGERGLTVRQIRERAELPHNGSMYDWFRGTGLWKSLIVTVDRDLYRLDVSPQT